MLGERGQGQGMVGGGFLVKILSVHKLNELWREAVRAIPAVLLATAIGVGLAWVLAEWLFPR